MQNMYYDHKPDPLEKKIRFGCGFIFGLVIGFFAIARMVYRTDVFLYIFDLHDVIIVSAVILGLLCGWLALKYGDQFWQEMCQLRWW